jgi:hypothetical protein
MEAKIQEKNTAYRYSIACEIMDFSFIAFEKQQKATYRVTYLA